MAQGLFWYCADVLRDLSRFVTYTDYVFTLFWTYYNPEESYFECRLPAKTGPNRPKMRENRAFYRIFAKLLVNMLW
jgi:hypothetical protein